MTSAKVISEITDRAERLAFIRRAMARNAVLSAAPKGRSSTETPPKALTASAGIAATPAPRVSRAAHLASVSNLRTAVHEAAHAAVGVLCGAEIDRAESFAPGMKLSNGAQGYCRYQPFGVEAEQRQPLIAAAGAVAEAILLHGRAPTAGQVEAVLAESGSDAEDLHRMSLARCERSDPMAALPLVLRLWPAITALTIQLEQTGVIHHSDVTAALGLSKDKARHGFELANIRSGLREIPAARLGQTAAS